MIIFGVVIKNTLEQIHKPNHSIGKPVGMFLFIFGWLYLSYILSLNKPNKLLFILPALVIIFSVIMMKNEMSKHNPSNNILMLYSLLFTLSWIVLGFNIGNHLNGITKYTGLLSSFLILASMLYMLPYQRKNCIVDGPGMPLFMLAFGIIILLNSNR